MTIINIRGTNGSGKSHVARSFLTKTFNPVMRHGLLGARNPEAYECTVPGATRPLFVLGPYWTPTGGCDAIQPYEKILQLVEKYAPRGHVLFEGSLVSDNYGTVGSWLEQHAEDALVVFLNTPLEVCLKQLRQRTEGAGEKHVAKRYAAIERVRQRLAKEGKIEWVSVSADAAIKLIPKLVLEGA